MSLLKQVLDGLYLGLLTGILPALIAWVLAFVFRYFTGVTLPGFGVVVLGVAIAGLQGGLLALTDPTVVSSPVAVVALIVVMMLTLYAHSKGDEMGANFPRRITWRSLGRRTLSSDVVERIGKFGQVRVRAKGEIGDIEGYPSLSPELRNELREKEWTFPADVSIRELETRLTERIVNEYDLSEVEVSIDDQGKASINAAPPVAGLSKRVPPNRRAVSVDLLVPTGLGRGDEVTVRTPERDFTGTVLSARSDKPSPGSTGSSVTSSTSPSSSPASGGSTLSKEPQTQSPTPSSKPAPVTRGGEGRVTVALPRDEARDLLKADESRLIVNPRGKRREFELISLLKKRGTRFSKLSMGDSSLVGKTLEETSVRDTYGVAVLAIRRMSEGQWIVSPEGSTEIRQGDELFVVGKRDNLANFREVVE